ncbi:hypothetical protein JXA88_11345 [Candidatus Fermentibacteria bacterium]|nr:hypothetical protein [Candidatus Fermentibacteria bacterium]
MRGLVRLTALIVVGALLYSVVIEVWRAITFDSEFTGLVHRARRADAQLCEDVRRLAEAKDIVLVDRSMEVTPAGSRSQVSVRYTVPLGLGGVAVTWERAVSAFTEGAAPFGAPLAGEQAPSAPRPGSGTMGLPSQVRKSLRGAQGGR